MKLACSSPMVPGATLTEKAERLRTWGFAGMSVFVDLHGWTPAVRDEVLDLERRTGVAPCELVLTGPLYGRLMDADPDRIAAARAIYVEAAQTCARIGAVTDIEFEYKLQDPMPLFHPYQPLEGERRAGFLRVYRDVLRAVEGSGAAVLLEPLNRYESGVLNRVRDCVDLLRELDHPNAGLVFDFFHSSIEEANLADAILCAGDTLRHVHLGDNNRLLPGHGTIDWTRCFAALREVGFEGYASLECSTTGDPGRTLEAAAAYLSGL